MLGAVESAVKSGADIRGAYLSGAIIFDEIRIEQIPITISTGMYDIIIFDSHMKIGCKFHSLKEWWGFDDKTIIGMGGKRAAEFWKIWKAPLMSICEANGREIK